MNRTKSNLTLSWSIIAFSAAMVAVASTATLAVIANVKNVDSLSTIALVLAILAFVIQIVVFIAQAWTSNQQMLQSQVLNADTRTLLAELQESTRATNYLITQQLDRIIGRLLVTAEQAVEESAGDIASLRSRLRTALADAVRQETGGRLASGWDSRRPGRDVPMTVERTKALQRMLTYPSSPEEFQAAIRSLRGLPTEALNGLHSLADDVVFSIELGRRVGQMRPTIRGFDELDQEGLVTAAPDYPSSDVQAFTLSPKGESLGRLLTARDEAPPELADELRRIRLEIGDNAIGGTAERQ
jgi:hypothetical protein